MILLLAPLLSGLLLALALPPYDIEWLGWIGLVPLLLAAPGRRTLEVVGMGMLAGLVCGFIHVGWSVNGVGLQFAYLPFLWLAMLLGIVTDGAMVVRPRLRDPWWALFVACLGVAVEWGTTFTPLPLNLALCQYRSLPVIQIASITGVWGVSFLLWWVNAAMAAGLARLLKARTSPTSVRKAHPLSQAAPLIALALTVGYGYLTLASTQHRTGPLLRVAAIQDHNAGETAQLVAATTEEEADRDEMTRQAASRGAKLIVWSENCLGATFAPDEAADSTVALARKLQAHLVVGYTDAARPKPFNCAAVLAPDGSLKGVHHKLHPFLGERQTVQAGHEATAFATALGKIGVEICFDTCYTSPTRSIARAGAQLIAMPNFDPPTRHGVLHRLHAAVLPFRAVENRVPFVRSDSNGLSQIVDATGRIVGQSSLYAADTLVADVPLGDGHGTPFSRLGDWFVYLCLLGVSVFAWAGRRSRVAVTAPCPIDGAPE